MCGSRYSRVNLEQARFGADAKKPLIFRPLAGRGEVREAGPRPAKPQA